MIIQHVNLTNEILTSIPIAACIGHFDGLHLGHQELMTSTIKHAKDMNLKSAMITFDPDPLQIISKKESQYLSALDQKIIQVQKFGLDIIYILDFTETMANLSAEDFITEVLLKLNIKILTCGFDFHFGKNGIGNAETLRSMEVANFMVDIVEPVLYHGRKISSTWISECLEVGDVELANTLLGYPFCITGLIIKGHQIGHKLNFPTANLDYSVNQLLPKIGVYVGNFMIDNKVYQTMINIGDNPTFFDQHKITIEAHILDFYQDIYNREATIEFLSYLRNEVKYATADDLVKQLKLDVEMVRQYFASDHEENNCK